MQGAIIGGCHVGDRNYDPDVFREYVKIISQCPERPIVRKCHFCQKEVEAVEAPYITQYLHGENDYRDTISWRICDVKKSCE